MKATADEHSLIEALWMNDPPQQAPDQIAFFDGDDNVPNGKGHLIWTIAIGKDHVATVYMDKEAWEKLQERTK